MHTQNMISSEISRLFEKSGIGDQSSESVLESELMEEMNALLANFREEFARLEVEARQDHTETIAIGGELEQNIKQFQELWDKLLEQNPALLSHLQHPFPHSDISPIKVADIPYIINRMDGIATVERSEHPSIFELQASPSFIKESNPYLENIQLLEKYNSFHISELNRLQQEEMLIEEESAQFNYFMEALLKLEAEINEQDLDEVQLDGELQEKILKFQEVYWPRILKRNEGVLPDHRNPFPKDFNTSIIKAGDVSVLRGKLSYLANQQNRTLNKYGREYQSIVNANYHCTLMMTHQTVKQLKAFVDNQKTR